MTSRFNWLRRKAHERMIKKQRIKESFADTGDADKMIKALREKRKPKIKAEDLPF